MGKMEGWGTREPTSQGTNKPEIAFLFPSSLSGDAPRQGILPYSPFGCWAHQRLDDVHGHSVHPQVLGHFPVRERCTLLLKHPAPRLSPSIK